VKYAALEDGSRVASSRGELEASTNGGWRALMRSDDRTGIVLCQVCIVVKRRCLNMKNLQKALGLRDGLIGFSLLLARFGPGRLFSETLNISDALKGIVELNQYPQCV
jgi:hypothetical protein